MAVRIVRPYETEEAFLESELETVGKTSVILIGAHSRPTGVILRFEVSLASGVTVLRGEGRVLAHKESAFRGQPGLALRFTRLDPKSKALVDRAAAMREARLARDGAVRMVAPPPPSSSSPIASVPPPSSSSPLASVPPPASIASARPPAASSRPSALASSRPPTRSRSVAPSAPPPPKASVPPDPGLAQMLTSPTPPPPALESTLSAGEDESIPTEVRSGPPSDVAAAARERELDTGTPSQPPEDADANARSVDEAQESAGAEGSAPPADLPAQVDAGQLPDRDSLLSKLRQRAAGLTQEQLATILRRPV